jgi:MurNAc alpha-1-phosphate uridylyltransferase
MSVAPRQAMVLAAGLGTRMRPLTEWTAKPLLPLGGRALLDHALQRLAEAGVARVVVNAHWQAGVVRAHLARWRGAPEIVLREEASLLDTGGAVLAALEAGDLADAPFFVVNGDAFWLDGPSAALGRLARRFDPAPDVSGSCRDRAGGFFARRMGAAGAARGDADRAVYLCGGAARGPCLVCGGA